MDKDPLFKIIVFLSLVYAAYSIGILKGELKESLFYQCLNNEKTITKCEIP